MLTRRQLLGGLVACVPLMGMTKNNTYHIDRRLYGREELKRIIRSEDLISVIEFKKKFFCKFYENGHQYHCFFHPNFYFKIKETSFNRDEELKLISINYTIDYSYYELDDVQITVPIKTDFKESLVTRKEFDEFNLNGMQRIYGKV